MIHLSGSKHALRTNRSPDLTGRVNNLGTCAGEALCVVRVAEVGDVGHHPAEHAGLGRGREDRGVDLPEEEDAWWDFHVLAEFEILSEIHAVFDGVILQLC